MFTLIDKNLLIAALESAIYHACVNANIVSLHAIETGVSALRQRFDANPDDVTESEIFEMVETIERATIPALSHISAIDNDTDIADRVVSFLWQNIVGKPTTFPPATHQHVTTEISDFPTAMPPTVHGHAYSEISEKPATFPSDWNTMSNKPTIPSGSGGSVVNVSWGGDDTNNTVVSIGITPKAMIVYEYEHGIRAFWNLEFGDFLGFDDGTAAEGVTFRDGIMTLAPGTLGNKANFLYYATIWG